MGNINPHAPPGFREAFDAARERTVSALVAAVADAEQVVCGPLSGFGMFGWRFEGRDPSHSSAMQGDLEYGKAYARHMIDQGFETAFAAWRSSEQALVCLKTWEPGEQEPEWPKSIVGAVVGYHKPPIFPS